MGKIVVSEFVTLDGAMESPHEWSFAFWNDEAAAFKLEELQAGDALLLGRVTYEMFAAAWPSMTDEQGFADRMNALPKHVATSTLEPLDWNASRLEGDFAASIEELKQQYRRDILVFGSADLVNGLRRYNLVERNRLRMFSCTTALITALLALTFSPSDTGPRIIHRDKQPYAAIRTTVTMQNYGIKAPPLWHEVTKWLVAKGMRPSGPPIARYVLVDMPKEMTLEIGFPVAKAMKGDGRVVTGYLPAGRYVEVVHHGDYSGMVAATGALQDWAKSQGLKWQMRGSEWLGRVEFNRVDPGDTPDSSRWETQILFLVK